jgi:DNA-binding transcriptional MerR regulator
MSSPALQTDDKSLHLQLRFKVKGRAMRIGEIAKRSGLSPSRIRFYEAHGLLPKAGRGENGYRDYPADIVETLSLIDQAQGLGFTLNEIRSALAQGGGNPPTKPEMLAALRGKLAAINQHIEEATLRRHCILALIAKFEGGC